MREQVVCKEHVLVLRNTECTEFGLIFVHVQFHLNSKIQFLNACPFSVVNDELLVNYKTENVIGTFCTVPKCGFEKLTHLLELNVKSCFFLGQLPCALARLFRRTSSANFAVEP